MAPLDLLRSKLLIRVFETALMQRADHGFQLLSSGEEAVAVGLCAALTKGDQLLASGRSIGPALARGVDPRLVMAELLGKIAGPCRGRGGRGHLSQPSEGFFGAHAVVGGNLTIAAGVALAAQLQGRGAIVACIFGDGACGSGALHETLNIAALWKLPLLFVCDNNQYSVSTRCSEALAPERLSDLAKPFGIPSKTIDGMDVIAVRDAARGFAEHIRAGRGPAFLECLSRRFATHSTSTQETRPAAELAAHRELCPIRRFTVQLFADGSLSQDARARLEAEVQDRVADAVQFADAAPFPDPSQDLCDAG
jgi:TPP-dependent pyruvate/acetoin dehydrogenase alpha subunit